MQTALSVSVSYFCPWEGPWAGVGPRTARVCVLGGPGSFLRGGRLGLGGADQAGSLGARILGVKLVAQDKWAGTVSLAGGAAQGLLGPGAADGRGDGSYATGFGSHPVGRREPSKVIGQGSDRTGEALYRGDTGSCVHGTGDQRRSL